MSEIGNNGKELFSRTVKAGKRTYFISVKEASNNKKYLSVTESKVNDDNKFDRFKIMIFQEKIGDFAQAFQEACKAAA